MILGLYGLILCFYVVQPVVERLLGLLNYLKIHEELCTHTPKKLIWIYGVEQPELFKTIEEIWAPRQCEFVEGFPEDLMSRLEKTNDRGSLCIFDDVMNEVSSNATISKLFTRGRSHLGCSLVLMFQNIFQKEVRVEPLVLMLSIKYFFVIQETVCKFQS